MRGMFLLVEAARQLRGEAHGRQVENAKLACVSGTGGWFSSASTVILGVEINQTGRRRRRRQPSPVPSRPNSSRIGNEHDHAQHAAAAHR